MLRFSQMLSLASVSVLFVQSLTAHLAASNSRTIGLVLND